jgi:hypothetical protein
VKLLIHEYKYSAAQKNWTIPQAQHDWIFLLDADERPTKKLVEEIKNTIENPKGIDAFWITRQNTFMDKKLSFTWKSDAVIRLFRKSKCQYEDKHVHAEILCEGKIGRLRHKLTHDTYKGKGLEFHLNKGDRYSTWSAYDHVDKVGKVTLYHLAMRPTFAFVKHYFIKGGIFDGKVGFIISILTAWNVFIRFVKVWRIKSGEKIEKR